MVHQQRFTVKGEYSVCPSNMHDEAVMNCVQRRAMLSFLLTHACRGASARTLKPLLAIFGTAMRAISREPSCCQLGSESDGIM
jgi:hypothetical protein